MANMDTNTPMQEHPTPTPLPIVLLRAYWRDVLTLLLLVAILAAGYGLRSVGRNWDDYTHLHPDERFLTDVASRIGNSPLFFGAEQAGERQRCDERYPPPNEAELAKLSPTQREYRLSRIGRGGYFDAQCSDLNPNNIGFGLYVYGQFPLFTTRLLGETLVEAEYNTCLYQAGGDEAARNSCDLARRGSVHTGYNGVHLVGRMMSSAADTLTILLLFLIGLKLFNRWVGLVAAFLYAFAAFPIQQSHFWTADVFTATWVTLGIYAAVNALHDDARRPARYSPLAWIAAAFGLWVWELERLSAPSFAPLLVYGVAFGLVGVLATSAPKKAMGAAVGVALAVLVAGAAWLAGIITLWGVVGTLVLGGLLAGFIWAGLNRLAAYGGSWLWLMGAFGLWVYDSLAHYARPSLMSAALYLVIFAVGAVLASALYRARNRKEAALWVLILGVPLAVWAFLDAAAGALSWEGMAASLLLVSIFSTATAYGYRDYAAFGVAFGAALASRVNVAPLVGVLVLAVLLRSLPILDRRVYIPERYRLATRGLVGVLVAGALALLFFRVLQPHAFTGLYTGRVHLGIIPTGFNAGWLDDIGQAQYLVSGQSDIPPNHQWASRKAWLFPWQNMVLYGMGPGLGLAAWAGVLLALWRIVRNRPGWMYLALPVAWVLVYFGWLGRNWVSTMRYFLPIYGMLALLAAWVLVGGWRQQQRGATRPRTLRVRRSFMTGLLLTLVLGYTALYGYALTNIHRHLLTRTAASLWFQENVPGNLGIWIEREDGGYSLQNVGTSMVSAPPVVEILTTDAPFRLPLNLTGDAQVESVVLHRVTDTARNDDEERISLRFERRTDAFLGQTVARRTLETDFNRGFSDFGIEHSIRFDDEDESPTRLPYLPTGSAFPAEYELVITLEAGAPLAFSRNVSDSVLPITLDHITVHFLDPITGDAFTRGFTLDDASDTTVPYTFYMPAQRGQNLFTARTSGTITRVEIPHLADPLADDDDETLRVEINGANGELGYGQVRGNFLPTADGINTFGPGATVLLDPPLQVQAGELYTVTVVADAPLMTLGHVIATEGPWDDPLPYKVCPLPDGVELTRNTTRSGYTVPTCVGVELYGSHYYGMEMYLAAEDSELKRDIFLKTLDSTDYLTISSNRFYDSLSRIPYRFPLSMDYYDALFSGELGFELVLDWTSYPRAFGLEWKNQVLPTDDLPAWLNEFEAEEAFHVYDHPAIFVFRKTDAYDPAKTRAILNTSLREYKEAFGGLTPDAQPVNRHVVIAPEANIAPTGLMLPPDTPQGATWRDLFDPQALVNRSQTAAVVVWWGFLVLVGWLTFPLLFAIFPALPDHGYAGAKLLGLLLMAWLAWLGASLHLGTWNGRGIGLALGLVAAAGAGLVYPRRAAFFGFLRARWRHLLVLEAMSLVLFLAFLYVRYRNPDLWHNAFGGEKPMDFAYFNAVLRSQSFPPIDPWFAGGYINYYYWGFVLVGAPVKLLGIVPAVAYNLIIPALFSMTAMLAFAVAYNLSARRPDDTTERRAPHANPWVAGVAALLMVTVLGNLDTLRVLTLEVGKVGGWSGPAAYNLTEDRRQELLADFRRDEEREPTFEEQQAIEERAANPPLTVKARHTVTLWRDMLTGFGRGIDRVIRGEPLQMATHRWYWAPTRVIAELPDGRGHNAINEMPYFTFLYGDLHAHMMAMPMMLFALLWLVAELRGAASGLSAGVWSVLVGGVVVGLLRATNTWDLPTFLILGVAGLTFAAWLGRNRQQIPKPALFYHLRAYLDGRRALRLWMAVWLLPFGALLHGLVWLLRLRHYDAALRSGTIPAHCLNLSSTSPLIPSTCEGLVSPSWTLGESLLWALGLFLLGVLAYVALLVLTAARFNRDPLLAWLGRLGVFGAAVLGAAAPYSNWFAGQAGIVPWEFDRTPLWAYLDIHGLFLFILFSFLVWQSGRALRRFRVRDLHGLSLPALLVIAGVPLTLFAAVVIGMTAVPVMFVTLPLLVWTALLFLVPGTSAPERAVYALVVLALGLTTGVELVVLDVDIGRQNTLFKFYMQAWLLFGVGAGVALAWLVGAMPRWSFGLMRSWQIFLAALATLAALYPIMATQARWVDRFDTTATGNTLDGQAYMPHAVYGDNAIWFNFVGDYHLINWLNANIDGTPTIIEAQTTEYKWGSRIAINTGLPTVIGWNWHQRQQRGVLSLNQVVWNRSNNVQAFYTTPDIETAWNLIAFYDIEYIILGVLERVVYNDLEQNVITGEFRAGLSDGIAKFDQMVDLGLLEVVYEQPACVDRAALAAADCEPHKLVTDKVYRVVPNASFQQVGG